MPRRPIVPHVHPGGPHPRPERRPEPPAGGSSEPRPAGSPEPGASGSAEPRPDEEPASPGPDPQLLRDAFARWASGVSVLALRDDDGLHALTVSAFMPLSLAPPLLALAVGEHAPLASMLVPGAEFTVSVLGGEQRRQASIFADAFAVDRSALPPHGDAVLAGSLAAFSCRIESVTAAGDHLLVLGAVLRAVLGPDQPPLLYFERAYRWLRE